MRSSVLSLWITVLASAVGLAQAPAQTPRDPVGELAAELRAKHYDQALKLARSALEHSPGDVRILTMEAIALAGLGKDSDALRAYHQALRVSPDYLAALEGAAELEYKAGSDRAVPLLDHLLKLQPGNATAHAMRAVTAWKAQDCETAVRHFALASAAIASQPEAQQEYGACLVRLNRPAEAVSVFRQLAAMQPADRRVRYRLAAAQYLAKSYADAIETLQPLIQEKDADPDALDLASAAWESTGDTPRAVAALRQAIVLAPSNPKYYVDFASLCLVHKSFDVGVDMINAGLSRLPDNAQLYLARGVLNVQLAHYEEADADFARAERLDPGEAYGPVAHGLSLVQQNDLEQALATVRAQLKTRQNDAFLYYLLAEILSSRGAQTGSPEFREAVAAASHAVQLNPKLAIARDVLSKLYLDSDETDKAIEQCRLALRDNPLDATALYRLIRALQKSGRPEAAAEIKDLLERFKNVREQLGKREAEESRYRLIEGSADSKKQ